ncbi:lipopolysaccharide assembly protein LapA domain-containing protein [Thalassotalea aquiviva]|uniref:lipopolysaccharide assembly protein LapA domain-containing protein n=1 Tax=Thalassotalea aquiviva TaxID=3242415 RepID=UPI003529FBE1
MKLIISLLLFFALLLVALIFGSQNKQIIELNYIIAATNMSVAMAVSIFTLTGFFMGALFVTIVALTRKLRRKKSIASSDK